MIKLLNHSGLELFPYADAIVNALRSQLERFLIISNSIGLNLKWSNLTTLEKEKGGDV